MGVGKGAENNILIKDAESLELGSRVNAVILDKTGTLTEGNPSVIKLHWFAPDTDQKALMRVLYALEAQSEHPLADAVVERLKQDTITGSLLDTFESLTGRGVLGRSAEKQYVVGNARLLAEHRIPVGDKAQALAADWQQAANTVVYFADAEQLLALIAMPTQQKLLPSRPFIRSNGGVSRYT